MVIILIYLLNIIFYTFLFSMYFVVLSFNNNNYQN